MAEETRRRRQGEDPDAHLPALLEAVAPANDRGPTVPGVQVPGLEHAAPDAHPAARLPPLRARVEAAAGDAFDLPEVQVEALADGEAAVRPMKPPRGLRGFPGREPEMTLALVRHTRLLQRTCEHAFAQDDADYLGEVAGKLRLLSVRSKQNEPLLLRVMEVNGPTSVYRSVGTHRRG